MNWQDKCQCRKKEDLEDGYFKDSGTVLGQSVPIYNRKWYYTRWNCVDSEFALLEKESNRDDEETYCDGEQEVCYFDLTIDFFSGDQDAD